MINETAEKITLLFYKLWVSKGVQDGVLCFAEGAVYDDQLETEVTDVQTGTMPKIDTKIMMNVGNPQLAFEFAALPCG